MLKAHLGVFMLTNCYQYSGISVQDPNANKKKEKTPDGPNETVRNLLKKAAECVDS